MKNFILAARPKTLVAAFVPPFMSFLFAGKMGFIVEPYLVFCCIISALFIQLATNFFNDFIDFTKGADKVRLGPVRVTSSGLVSMKKIQTWAFFSLLGASLFGVPLVMKGGQIILLVGIISLYLTYGYTGGPFPIAYLGLGEIFVFLFFGLFSVIGSYYIYTSEYHQSILSLAMIYGLLCMTFICVNNLRDREEDEKVNKLTLATKISENQYILLTISTVLIPYLIAFPLISSSSLWTIFIPLPIATRLLFLLKKNKGESLNLGLKLAGIHLILFSIFLNLGVRF
jgi:1,4-dihydroxy-2-naphthoate octaprenyltransferase